MPLMASGPLRPSTTGSRRSARAWHRYSRDARRPWHSLLFVVPLVIGFELGAALLVGDDGGELIAPRAIRGLLGWFGLVGSWVPGVVLVAVLLTWHRLSNDRWRVRGWVLAGMLAESVLLAVPLLVISSLFVTEQSVALEGSRAWLWALGAGVYEELLFRLLLISGLTWFAVHVLTLPATPGAVVAVVVAACVFAMCHFTPIGAEPFAWRVFWYKFVAGGYLGAVFLGRGFGVTAGAHVAGNLLMVAWGGG